MVALFHIYGGVYHDAAINSVAGYLLEYCAELLTLEQSGNLRFQKATDRAFPDKN